MTQEPGHCREEGEAPLPDAASTLAPQPHAAAARGSWFGATARGVAWACLALALAFFALVALYAFVDPVSTLMLARLAEGQTYQQSPVRLADVSPAAVAAVVASEDATFCANRGVDWDSLTQVLASASGRGPSRGASTLTMQTVKNLFLWPGRSVVRKGLEIPMALVLGTVWPKRRVMEIYLNIAEWGEGVFGIEAAAERAFHKRASELSPREGALLATALPNPRERDPARPSGLQRRHAAELLKRVAGDPDALRCL